MAVDDSNLYSRTKNKLNSSPNELKSLRRSSLPLELPNGNHIKGKLQRNIKNLEAIHLRRPKKRPSIFPVTCSSSSLLLLVGCRHPSGSLPLSPAQPPLHKGLENPGPAAVDLALPCGHLALMAQPLLLDFMEISLFGIYMTFS
ncbi:hypothetical protein LEMLEM_LOCUS20984 [Lemmus lemmus]